MTLADGIDDLALRVAQEINAVRTEALNAASETVAGVAELATQAEVNAGTDDTRIVTPLKLATHLASYGKFAADCAATTNPQNFDHGLGLDVAAQVWEGDTQIYPDVTKSSTNGGRITVDYGAAPTAGQYRVIVFGPTSSVQKYAADSVATTNPQNFDHGLGTDVHVSIWEGNTQVFTDVTKSSTNGGRVTIDFGSAPTAGQYRVVVMG